jgi:hypothetical protein
VAGHQVYHHLHNLPDRNGAPLGLAALFLAGAQRQQVDASIHLGQQGDAEQPCFERMEQLLAAPPLRQAFGRFGDRTLIAWDRTEYFCSQKLGRPHCLRRSPQNPLRSGGKNRWCT